MPKDLRGDAAEAAAQAEGVDFAFSAGALDLPVPTARLDEAGDADVALRVRLPARPANVRAIATRLATLAR